MHTLTIRIWLYAALVGVALAGSGEGLRPAHAGATAAPKVVYGADDRREVKDLNGDRAANAAATVGLFRGDAGLSGKVVRFPPLKTLQQAFGLCPGQRFATQPVLAFCSGALVAPDVVLTAGHCVKTADALKQILFIFDFDILDNGRARVSFPENRVYAGKSILRRVQTSTVDFALIRLDRNVTGRTPAKVSAATSLAVGTSLYVIGHPSGLPTKYAAGARITSINAARFGANLDVFEGNSGSPVFNAGTDFIVGVLDNGQEDYVRRGSCSVVNQVPDYPGREFATRSTVFQASIPD